MKEEHVKKLRQMSCNTCGKQLGMIDVPAVGLQLLDHITEDREPLGPHVLDDRDFSFPEVDCTLCWGHKKASKNAYEKDVEDRAKARQERQEKLKRAQENRRNRRRIK